MSYVVQYAESVHSTFRAPNNFCHDLQHVMRGAVKNLGQTCLLTDEPVQLARYQLIFTSLQTIIDTKTTMSECTVEQSDTLTMMDSAADYLAAASTADSLVGQQQRRTNLSASSFKSSDAGKEQTFDSFDQVAAENLSAVLPSEMLHQLGEVYDVAVLMQNKEAELKVREAKVKKHAKHKPSEKLREAELSVDALRIEVARLKGVLQENLDKCFPAIYKCILREYIDLCNSLLRATQLGTEILTRGAADGGVGETNGSAVGTRQVSAALTVDALEAHEALEEVKLELQQHHHQRTDSKTQEEKLQERINALIGPAPPQDRVPSLHTLEADASTHRHEHHQGAEDDDAVRHHTEAAASPTKSGGTSTAAPSPSATAAAASRVKVQPKEEGSTQMDSLSSGSVPAATPKATGATQRDTSQASFTQSSSSQTQQQQQQQAHDTDAAPHAEECVSPSLAGTVHAKFPFWFRYFYFDRLANSTERLAIAFGLYVSYCKRFARKAGYTIPLPIKKHMDRIEMEFTTARYARHKREFQAVLKEIFTYRKNLEVMETYVRLAREAEVHVNKHAKAKNKKGLLKWNERLKKANDSIEQLRVEVFGRGADDMVQFYDQLLRCIQGSLRDLMVTLGGTPEQ